MLKRKSDAADAPSLSPRTDPDKKCCSDKKDDDEKGEEKEKPSYPIPGLVYRPEFITAEEECGLLADIDAVRWCNYLRRRTQHYGYRYDYISRSAPERLGPLPDWCHFLVMRLLEMKLLSRTPNQLIVNEYLPGQGIAPHVDAPVFADGIVSISLGSPCVMVFSRDGHDNVDMALETRSVVVLHGEARKIWRHSIPARKVDVVQGVSVPRHRRVSLTFRCV